MPSPSRRTCNVPPNKRVEMLRNCEADLRRELSKNQKQTIESTDSYHDNNNSFTNNNNGNKPFEKHHYDTTSMSGSPKSNNGGHFSPKKTHVSNFINQNTTPNELIRRNSTPEPPFKPSELKRSPQFQITDRKILSPPKSPTPRRRFRSQSPRVCIDSDSDSEDNSKSNCYNGHIVSNRKNNLLPKRTTDINGNKENNVKKCHRKNRQLDNFGVIQHIIPDKPQTGTAMENGKETPDMGFHLIDIVNNYNDTLYCPQSEPLKRKIYSEKTLDRLQKSLEMESG